MLARMLNLFPRRDITAPDGTLYLQRWTLLRILGRKVMIHRIVRPDSDREPHDHPFRFTTIVLRGGYVEGVWHPGRCTAVAARNAMGAPARIVIPDFIDWLGPGRVAHRTSMHTHRIVDLPNGPAWTLVLRGRRRRQWGFHTDCGWVEWRQFIARRHNGLPVCED